VPDRSRAEVYSSEIKEWVRVNDEGLVRPAPSAPFKRHLSIDKETGNAVGDALSAANHWCSALAAGTEGGSVEFVFGRSQFDVDDEGPNRCCTSILH
jgi:hypothetical protein